MCEKMKTSLSFVLACFCHLVTVEAEAQKYLSLKAQPIHVENEPCASISNFIDNRGGGPAQRSAYERRSVGIDDRLLSETAALPFRQKQLLSIKGKHYYKFDPTAIMVTDPEGKINILKGYVHVRVYVEEFRPLLVPHTIMVQMVGRNIHSDWHHTAAQGQFVHDFPGYEECEVVKKDIKAGISVRPSPFQFVPCQGASSGDNEFANMYIYNSESEAKYGGTTEFKRVHHLFWKYHENSCNRKYTEFTLEILLSARLQDAGDVVIFHHAFTVGLGDESGHNFPVRGYDPVLYTGPGWKWDCGQVFIDENGVKPEIGRWFQNYWVLVDQVVTQGEIGSCKVDGLDGDEALGPYGGQFYGRCEAVTDDLRWTPHTDAVFTPSPYRFHTCSEEDNLKSWKGQTNPPLYGETFGLTYLDNLEEDIVVAPAEICGVCHKFPTREQVLALMPEIAEQEKKEKEERERQRIKEEQRKKAEEERKKAEEERRKEKERLEKNKTPGEDEDNRRYKGYSVRFDDEDDGWWSARGKEAGVKELRQRPMSPVALLGLSVWRFRKLHGIFEIIVAFFLTPVCVFVSRYFKETWLGSRVLGQPAWLMAHLWTSIVSLLFHMFGCHTIEAGVGLMGRSKAPAAEIHKYLGLATLLLFFALNFLGAFRPVGLCARRICIIFHWLFGIVAYALNFACVLTSIRIPGSPSAADDISYPAVLHTGRVEPVVVLTIAFIVIDIIFHVAANVMMFISDQRENVQRLYFPTMMACVDEDELIDTAGSTLRKVLLLVYVIVAALITIAVVGVVYSQSPHGRAFFKTTMTHNEKDELYGDLLKENDHRHIFPPFF